jgi:hypothetical protein
MVLLLAALTVFILKKKKGEDHLSLMILSIFLILVAPLLVLFISNNFTPMYNHRYFIFMVIPSYILVSYFINELLDKVKGRLPNFPLTFVVISILILPSILTDIDQIDRDDKPDWKAGIDMVLKYKEDEDVLIPFPDYEQMIIFYYTDDITIQRMSLVDDHKSFINDHSRVWVMFNEIEEMDKYPLIQALNEWQMKEYQTGDIHLRLYVKYTV